MTHVQRPRRVPEALRDRLEHAPRVARADEQDVERRVGRAARERVGAKDGPCDLLQVERGRKAPEVVDADRVRRARTRQERRAARRKSQSALAPSR